MINESVQCHIHDNVNKAEVDSIHENICSGVQQNEHEAHQYCIFHLPTKDKSADFGVAFERKLKSVKAALLEIEACCLSPAEILKRKEKISYDFRYVYFPTVVNLSHYVFYARTQFTQAVFTGAVDLSRATFIEPALFDDVVFEEAYFRGATFLRRCDFRRANFNRFVNFTEATFANDATFVDARFAALSDFSGALFAREAVFKSAKFLDQSETFFQSHRPTNDTSPIPIRFCGVVDFQYASLAGFIDFSGWQGDHVFLDREAVSQVKDELSAKFVAMEQTLKWGLSGQTGELLFKEAALNFENVQVNTPGRVSFHQVRLRPSWFINVDSRKLIFTSVSWQNLTRAFVGSSISDEIASLEKRHGTTEAIRLLEVSCRQLSANAEENSRYAEASSFRRIAMALDWRMKKAMLFPLIKKLRLPERVDTGFRILRSCGELAMHSLYRLTSCYGESWVQAAGILFIVVLAIFPFAYCGTTFIVCPTNKANSSQNCLERRLSLSEGIRNSLTTATLQTTEFRKPNSAASETFTIVERIFGPIQAALLALAIRRRFMR
ncbi:MAG TPA: pentapeptide repeat-containing protein [Pyrinomonadaceae bacterium]|nr:pentapeptide repeat-containing protein [Pyrinomonadaceae bacterium]